MIKEISSFVSNLDTHFKFLGTNPKSGLHILLSISNINNILSIEKSNMKYVSTKKGNIQYEESQLLDKVAKLSQLSWCVNTNKCFDLPTKAIHSCSPYCVAIKRENLTRGDKYNKNTKSQVYERIDDYFNKAIELIKSENDKQRAHLFKNAINSEAKFNSWLDEIEVYKDIKDSEYVIFYLDESIESYTATNDEYLKERLFNTNEYNKDIDGKLFGTSDFFNSYSQKKQFLIHKTSPFDISNRISSQEAKDLYEFQNLLSRNILPNPLPIFIFEEELQNEAIRIFKKGIESGDKKLYSDIFKELNGKKYTDIGNYYLLFYERGEIKDFDFVSNFKYDLKDSNGQKWKIRDYFDGGNGQTINNIFHFQQAVLLPVFNNNGLVTIRKDNSIHYKYFEEIESKYCKSDTTYVQILKYRKAFYDFIYKSRRESISSRMFNEILQTSILEDIRQDKINNNNFHTEDRNIKQKLNIWFSLTNNFITPTNNQVMSSKLQENREFIIKLADGKADISTDEEYGFSVGQVIYYLLSKSKSSDKSYKRLEPFMQQVHSRELNKSIVRLFDNYKHENFSNNFKSPFAQVLSYETTANIRDLTPSILSGFFSENALFSNKEDANTNNNTNIEN